MIYLRVRWTAEQHFSTNCGRHKCSNISILIDPLGLHSSACVCVHIHIFVRQKEYNSLQIKQETHNYLSLCEPSNGNDSSRRHCPATPPPPCGTTPPRRHPTKVNKYNKTNVSQQIQTDKDVDGDCRTASRLQSARNFSARGFSHFYFSCRNLLRLRRVRQKKMGGLGAEAGSGNRRCRATYFVLNLLVHTNALLTVFRFVFVFAFISCFLLHFAVFVVIRFCLPARLEASSFG